MISDQEIFHHSIWQHRITCDNRDVNAESNYVYQLARQRRFPNLSVSAWIFKGNETEAGIPHFGNVMHQWFKE